MNRIMISALLTGATIVSGAAVLQAKAPAVTAREARAAAIYQVHGSPISTRLVHRHGSLQYVVLVKQGGSIEEVVVSPVSGQVIGHRPAGHSMGAHRRHHHRK